jgi:hypothetical protein
VWVVVILRGVENVENAIKLERLQPLDGRIGLRFCVPDNLGSALLNLVKSRCHIGEQLLRAFATSPEGVEGLAILLLDHIEVRASAVGSFYILQKEAVFGCPSTHMNRLDDRYHLVFRDARYPDYLLKHGME